MYDGPTIAKLVNNFYQRWQTSLLLRQVLKKYGINSAFSDGTVFSNEVAYEQLLELLDLTYYYTHGNGD